MDHDDVLGAMQAELARLRAEVQELRAQHEQQPRPVTGVAPAGEVVEPVQVVEQRTSRRGMLRLAGAAAAGAAAAAVGQAGQAAAADGEAVFAGRQNQVTRETLIRLGTTANGPGATPGAIIGDNLTAVLRLETNALSSAAMVASGSRYGVVARGFEEAFLSFDANYTFHSAASRKAAILLSAVESGTLATKTPPPTRTDFHVSGEMEVDGNGDLWWCVSTGTPGTWRKLAGPTTAGAFHAINPARVYDSRVAEGALGQGASRLVSVADGRDAAGSVSAPNVVPIGATAIAYNVTVADTVGAGFLAVAPGNSTGTSASSINWSGSGQLLSNGLQVGIDVDDRTVRVFSGGAGSTQFIIDVVGYYR
ncbi:MAG: hypothetical protein ACK5CE_01085 [Actinomycetes bacterium]